MAPTNSQLVQSLPHAKLGALVEMMFLAATADGEFSAIERDHFRRSVESLTDGRLGGEALDALLAQAERDLALSGREARLQAVKARLPDLGARRVALALAIEVTAADGVIRTSERELILETAVALDIDPEEAADMVLRVAPL